MTTVVAPVKTSGVDWKSIIAGAIAASAIFGLLTAFGTAVGLSLTSAHRGSTGLSASTLVIAASLWVVMVHVWSFVAGGYLAGRLSDVPDLHPEEAVFRAGANGFMVWALGTAIGLLFVTFVSGTVVRSASQVVGQAASGVVQAASNLSAENVSYVADALFRPQVSPGGAQPIAGSSTRPDPAVIAEAGRIFAVGLADGSLNADDRSYLAQLVARQTGLPEADAQRRVDETYARAQGMKEAAERQAREAADKARKQAVLAGFLAAAASLAGLVAAVWAAGIGHEHQNSRKYPIVFSAERLW